jgi:hypothetical protein
MVMVAGFKGEEVVGAVVLELRLETTGSFVWQAQRKRQATSSICGRNKCDPGLVELRPSARPGAAISLAARMPPAAPDDPCRTGSPEAMRAFDVTERLFSKGESR